MNAVLGCSTSLPLIIIGAAVLTHAVRRRCVLDLQPIHTYGQVQSVPEALEPQPSIDLRHQLYVSSIVCGDADELSLV